MIDLDKVKCWVEEYVRLKRIEAQDIEKQYGKGWISDSKYNAADEAEKWLQSNPTDLDKPIKVTVHSVPNSCKISKIFPNNCYTEYKFKDGTIKRICTIKP